MLFSVNICFFREFAKRHDVVREITEEIELLKKSEMLNIFINETEIHDIIHIQTLDMKSRNLLKKYRSKGKKAVISCHTNSELLDESVRIPNFIQRYLDKYLMGFYALADKLIVSEISCKKKLLKLGVPETKITIIPNTLSDKQFCPVNKQNKMDLRQKLDIEKEDFVVLGHGDIQKKNGIEDFIKTAGKSPEITFIWLGSLVSDTSDPYSEKYQALLKNLPSNMLFVDKKTTVNEAEYFKASDALLMPAYQENGSSTILKACNCHLPLILRDNRAYKELFFKKYISGNNSDEFSKKLSDLSTTSELYKKLMEKSREISEHYSENRILTLWEDLYISLLNEK